MTIVSRGEWESIMKIDKSMMQKFIEKKEVANNLSNLTVKAYKADLNDYLRFYKDLKVSKPAVINYIESLRTERQLKDTSIKRKIITLNLFFTFLCEENKIKDNPISSLNFHFKKEKRLPKTLSIREVTNMLKEIDKKLTIDQSNFSTAQNIRDAAILDLLISTGVRICEIASLKTDDIFYNERIILIHGKGRKQRLIYISALPTWQRLKNWIKLRKENANKT